MKKILIILLVLLFFSTLALGQELVDKRTYTSKIYQNGINSRTAEIYCGHIHYKDGDKFEEVDISWEDKGTYWQMKKANYKIYVSKTFDADKLIRFDNKYNGADHTIYLTPHSLQWVTRTDRQLIKAAQSVTGYISGHTIVYEDAFGNDIDFVIELKRAGFKKYIRFNTKPTLNPPSANHAPALLFKYQGDGLTVKANGDTAWDGVSYYEGIDGFEFSEGQYKSYLGKAYIWDSSVGRNKQKVKIFFEKRNGVLWQAKVFPKSYFADAVYPVMSDAYPYADSAGDGIVQNVGEAVWADAREAAAGDGEDTANNTDQIGANWEAGPFHHVYRGYFPFPTGANIPAVATITAATFSVYPTTVTDSDTGSMGLVQTRQNDVISLEVGDFDECGESLANGWSRTTDTDFIEGAARITLANITASQRNTWTLDATGRAWIARSGETKPATANTAGYTHLGLREGVFDLDDAAPTSGPNRIVIYFSDEANNDRNPLLTVTYTMPIPIYMYHYRNH